MVFVDFIMVRYKSVIYQTTAMLKSKQLLNCLLLIEVRFELSYVPRL